eukprot:12818378-Alexandrium_andersonii.AAC.1
MGGGAARTQRAPCTMHGHRLGWAWSVRWAGMSKNTSGGCSRQSRESRAGAVSSSGAGRGVA